MSDQESKSEMKVIGAQEQMVPWATFLAEFPVGTMQKVSMYMMREAGGGTQISVPDLKLHCEECKGSRNFAGQAIFGYRSTDKLSESILIYNCRDCMIGTKRYYLASYALDYGNNQGMAVKVGEYPELHISIPSNLPGLLGTDYPHFIKGLKCEKNGLGIGAYTYYRRVVENQKNRMLEEILKVAQKLNARPEELQAIQNAITETQFDKAMNMVKGVLPQSLLVGGHNPFKLIHKALSIGIHGETDETCMQLAQNIRWVLTDLSDRIRNALSEQREIQSAVSSLMKFNQEHR
jgi:hypothetical protein